MSWRSCVRPRGSPDSPMRNLGPVSRRWLEDIGVRTIDDLRRLGPVEAYVAVKQREAGASLNLLYALEAAVRGVDWRELSEAEKAELRGQVG